MVDLKWSCLNENDTLRTNATEKKVKSSSVFGLKEDEEKNQLKTTKQQLCSN